VACFLALTLVVRDEEEILASNLDYHLAQGVDAIVALDRGSADATPEILREYERRGRLRWLQDDAPSQDPAPRVARVLALAADEFAPEWVIHADADEFWMPTAGSLRDVFQAIPDRYGRIRVPRHDFVPVPETVGPFHQRMVVRHRRSLDVLGAAPEANVARRPASARDVELAPDIGALEILRFPIRSFDQFEREALRDGVAPELGGDLRAYYEAQLRSRDVIIDRRLQAFMATGPRAADESPAARALLRHTWAGVLREIELRERLAMTVPMPRWRLLRTLSKRGGARR
jgi:Glycosyl transferase family 2